MTNAPHLLPKSREGFKYGDTTLVDSMAYDGLSDAFTQQAMGGLTEDYNANATQLTREEQDAFSARSHQRAAAARKNGVFDDEIVPVEIPQRQGDPSSFADDEGIRADTTAESLGKLRPAFSKDGTITAGSASQISDGAAAVVVMSKAKAEELGLDVARRDRRPRVVAGPDSSLQMQPANAIRKALGQRGHRRRRPRPGRDQRGVRRRRHRVDPRARHLRRTRSTSTAARSRSATRSACPAPASCCTSRSSSSAAVAASARPRCAAAAARATP